MPAPDDLAHVDDRTVPAELREGFEHPVEKVVLVRHDPSLSEDFLGVRRRVVDASHLTDRECHLRNLVNPTPEQPG